MTNASKSTTDTPFLPYELGPDSEAVAVGEHAGLQYAVVKIDTGRDTQYRSHWACGYVLLPAGHPWREMDLQMDDYDKGPDVHGGITYGPTDGWIGFDFNHAGDIWPGSYLSGFGGGGVVRTVADVEAECLSLCEQAAR